MHGFTLTCTALRAISAMPGIGISRHAAQPATGDLTTEWAAIAAALLASRRD